jgi:uncharacterized protein (TIRG00374 family)
VRHVLGAANWRLLPLALLCAATSYCCLGYGFATVNHVFGLRMPRRDLFGVGVITAALNNLLSTGGLAGYSVRILLMRQRGLEVSDIVAASLFHSYLSSLAMLALLPAALVFLAMRHPLSSGMTAAVVVTAIVLVLVFACATALVIVPRARGKALALLVGLSQRLVHRDIRVALQRFDATVTRGVEALRGHPFELLGLIAVIITDWSATVACLGVCFDALGNPLKPWVLLTGFATGIVAGVLSMVPGGMGIQEGSMAGVFRLLGVPLEHAVLASILFRAIYYFVPFLISLAFYWGLLRAPSSRGDGLLAPPGPSPTA